MSGANNLKKYKCRPCGFVYDPERVFLTMVLSQVFLLKTFQMTGYVQIVQLAGGCSKKLRKTNRTQSALYN